MKRLLPIAAILCTVLTTLLMLVFSMAGMANAPPDQIQRMELWMGGFSLLALTCVIASIVLMRRQRHGPAALVAFLPTGILFWMFVWLIMR